MRAYVRFKLPDGTTRELGHGDVIGRLWSAVVQLDDPRISEAHAMVSLRGESLKLLALRGRIAVDERTVPDVELTPGVRVWLSRDHALEVEAVELPDAVLALEGADLPRQVLAGVCSLVSSPRPQLVPHAKGEAEAHFWSLGAQWRYRVGDGPVLPLSAGDIVRVGDRELRAVSVELGHAGQTPTQLRGGVDEPMRIVARFDSVHIHRQSAPLVVLAGLSARMISELASYEAPVRWEILAGELWPDETDALQLRRKLDVCLARLRAKLRDARIRTNLVRTDGSGNLELVLSERDTVIDQT